MKYLAHCVSGLQDVAWQHLSRDLGPFRLLAKEEGFLAFEGDLSPPQLKSVRYLNHCHFVVAELQAGDNLNAAARELTLRRDWHGVLRQSVARRERGFRLTLSDENHLVAGDREVIAELGSTVERLTGLKYAPRGGDVELWILRRRSGKIFFCKRLSRRSRTEKDLDKGELRPELAHLLCLLSEPQPRDVFLDAFAGSGAIPFARTYYPFNMILAFDHDESKVRRMKKVLKDGKIVRVRKRSPLIVHQGDARKLGRIENGFIDKVVTDPPWGFFDRSLEDPQTFYREVVQELCRVTKAGGLLVLLLGDRDLAARIAQDFAVDLELLASYQLLVSGKKAIICKFRKDRRRTSPCESI